MYTELPLITFVVYCAVMLNIKKFPSIFCRCATTSVKRHFFIFAAFKKSASFRVLFLSHSDF